MSVEDCFVVLPFIRYDGSNESEILDEASNGEDGLWTYSEDNGILTITVTYESQDPEIPPASESWSAPVGGAFVLRPRGGLASALTAEEFDEQYARMSLVLNPEPDIALGFAAVGSLNPNASVTIRVEIKPAFWDTNYDTAAFIVGALNVLGGLEVQSSTIIDESHVDVVVKNKALLSLSGGSVVVQAIK